MTVKDEKLVTTEELGEMDAQTSYLSPILVAMLQMLKCRRPS